MMPSRPKERLIDRLDFSRKLLVIHGFLSDSENEKCVKRLTKAAAKEHLVKPAARYPFPMNDDDHAPTCAIRTSRDGWDADCTCIDSAREKGGSDDPAS